MWFDAAMSHALHFLERVADRAAPAEMELALELYRDRLLVDEILKQEKPPGDGRVAFALTRTGGPFVVVERDGSFVTCLGAAMSHDLPIIGRGRIDFYVRTLERIRARLAVAREERAKSGEWPPARLLTRAHRVTREEFVAATAWTALGGHADLVRIADTAQDLRVLRKGDARRWTATRVHERERMEAAWNQAWYLGHTSVRLSCDGLPTFLENEPDPAWPAYFVWMPLRQGLVGPALRGLWAAGRLGKPVLVWCKELTVGSEFTLLCTGLSLLAIAAAHGKLAAEAMKVFERILVQADPLPFLAPWAAALRIAAAVNARTGSQAEAILLGSVRTAAFKRLSALRPGHRLLPARAEDLPDDLALAALATMTDSFEPEHVVLMGTLLPLLVRRPASSLYLPEEWVGAFTEPWQVEDTLGLAAGWARFDGGHVPVVVEEKPGRNDPCHCGSGRKFKKCHGA